MMRHVEAMYSNPLQLQHAHDAGCDARSEWAADGSQPPTPRGRQQVTRRSLLDPSVAAVQSSSSAAPCLADQWHQQAWHWG